MSYASLTAPAIPGLTLPLTHDVAAAARAVGAAAGLVLQCATMAALLWGAVAAPGLLSDRNSTGTHVAASSLHR